jgi:hypothetical protein
MAAHQQALPVCTPGPCEERRLRALCLVLLWVGGRLKSAGGKLRAGAHPTIQRRGLAPEGHAGADPTAADAAQAARHGARGQGRRVGGGREADGRWAAVRRGYSRVMPCVCLSCLYNETGRTG